jgi:hypothetical protein
MLDNAGATGLGLFLLCIACFYASRFFPKGAPAPPHAPAESLGLPIRTIMQVLLSLGLAGASLFIILFHAYDPKDKHWAYGTLGTILGFWLRSK